MRYLCCILAVVIPLYVEAAGIGKLDSTDIIFHFHGTDTLSRVGSFINSLGDINGDGFDDISVSSRSPKGTYIFLGGQPTDSNPDYFLRGPLGPAAAVDLTGDGFIDIITSEAIGIPAEEKGTLFFFRGFGDSIATEPFDSLTLDTGNYRFGWWFVADFVDSDNLADLLISQSIRPDGDQLLLFSGPITGASVPEWLYTIENPRQTADGSFGLIDFDGDGNRDIFVAQFGDQLDSSVLKIFHGPLFDTSLATVIAAPITQDSLNQRWFGRHVVNCGDLNADGWDDLLVEYNFATFLYFCGSGADTVFDYRLDHKSVYMARAGDVNGDGYNDLITGNGDRSASGSVDIYLGGPNFDPYIDDYIVRADLPPLFLEMIGYRVSSARDFDGDNVDDFIISCQNFAHGDPGDVFIFKGSPDIVTEVEGDNIQGLLPEQFDLHQNYPNPFNPTTTIEFDLPQRGHVKLIIFNILGKEVVTLVERELSAGSHSVRWDGRDSDGATVASGIYLYNLLTGNFIDKKKMLLLK